MEATDGVQADSAGEASNAFSYKFALVASPGALLAAPQLILLPPSTNLYETPARWLLRANDEKHSELRTSLMSYVEQQENDSSQAPDFATDNAVLRDLLAWKYSERMVSVVIQKFGDTLIIQSMNPAFTGPSPLSTQYTPNLVSGFNIDEPESQSEGSTSLEEQARLISKATKEILAKQSRKKKNQEKQKRAQLQSKLHCRILEQNDFQAVSPDDSVSVHHWRHCDHSVVLTSNLPIYAHRRKPTSIDLRDEKEGRHNQDLVARLFLDNLMASVPQLAVCWHDDGVIRRYETFKTTEIPNKLNDQEPLEVRDIERMATALLGFLKSNCKENLSVHWLFKGEGERVARLWRLDPFHDTSLDWQSRDKLLYQMSMLCLRASHARRNLLEKRRMLSECILMLDIAASLNSEHIGSMGRPLAVRRALRAGIRERLAELLMEDLNACDGDKIETMCSSMEILHEALLLLRDEEAKENLHNPGLNMVRRSQQRIAFRLLTIGQLLIELLRRGIAATDSVLTAMTRRALGVCDAIGSEIKSFLISANSDKGDSGDCMATDVLMMEQFVLFRIAHGELLMSQARQALRTEFDPVAIDTQFIAKALNECFEWPLSQVMELSLDSLLVNKLIFYRGNTINERGKVFLGLGRISDARECFQQALDLFHEIEDFENIAVTRCNIAHCFRVASTVVCPEKISSSDGSYELQNTPQVRANKISLLRCAVVELVKGLEEVDTANLSAWSARIKRELFRTHSMLGAVFDEDNPEAIKEYEKALTYAHETVDLAWANLRLGIARMSQRQENKTLEKLAKRNLEKAMALSPPGHIVGHHARIALFDHDVERGSPDTALKNLFKSHDWSITTDSTARDMATLRERVVNSISNALQKRLLNRTVSNNERSCIIQWNALIEKEHTMSVQDLLKEVETLIS